MLKPIWYDKKSFGDSYIAEEVIKKSQDRMDQFTKAIQGFYEDSRKYQRVYQYRSPLDTENTPSVDANFDVVSNNMFTFNIIRACANSAHNKIAKIKPKVTFLTKDADTSTTEIAKRMDSYIFSTYKQSKAYKEGSKAVLDCLISGLGICKIYKQKGKVEIKKISSNDFFMDHPYKGYSIPTECGEKKTYSSRELIEMFPTKADKIEEMHGDKENISVVEMYKAYKKKIIFTDKVLLDYSDWKYSLPYSFLKWTEATEGVIGISLAKELIAIQKVMTYILEKTLMSLRLFAVPKVLLEQGSNPTEKEIGNLVAEIIEYNKGSEKPTWLTPPAMNQQVLNILLMLWEKGFEVTGLSQLQAHGQLPQGLKAASGAALRTYNQIESERFQLFRTDYEDFYINIAEKIIEMDDGLKNKFTKKEVEMVKDHVNIFSSNILPETPAGRQALVSEMFNSNLITRSQALMLIDSPDTNKLLSSEAKRVQAIEILLEKSIKSKKLTDPLVIRVLGIEVFLDKARKLFAQIVVEEGEDSEKLTVLSEMIDELTAKVQAQAQMDQAAQADQQDKPTPKPIQTEELYQQ